MGSIRAIGTVAKLFKTQTVPEQSRQLFSFATKHRLKTPKGKLLEDGMILTHLSDFAPNRGFIDTAMSGGGLARDSVHFAVNHGVTAHFGGSWDTKKYAILIPMNTARQTTGNRFVGGVAGDFYSKGRVKIPKGSVLVRRTSNVPKGQYRISDASKIEEFKELHGVKLIETSSTDMKSTVDNIVRRLGYKTKSGDFYNWGGSLSDFNAFNAYLRKNGMKPMMHTYTPNGKIEQILANLKARVTNKAEWVVKDKMGNVIIDYQQEYLKSLKYINDFARKTGYPIDFDTKQITQIIRASKTPQNALELLESRLKIKTLLPPQKDASELELFTQFQVLVGGNNNIAQITDNIVLNYLKKANKKTSEALSASPSGTNCIPDAQLCEEIQELITKTLKKNHLSFDNTVANKLYELG